MKTYIIRNTGWTFNDSTYDRDGMLQIVYSFTDKEEAENHLHFLNREYLCERFNIIHRLEAGKPGMSRMEYLNGLGRLLHKEGGLNPTVLLPLGVDFSLYMFPQKPTDALLDRIVNEFDLTHFKLVEIDSAQPEYYYAILNGLYNYGQDEYLTNGYGDKNLLFNSLPEAIGHFLHFVDYIKSSYRKEPWVTLPKPESGNYSDMPSIFESLVEHNPHFRMEGDALKINGDTIDTETVIQLNALLKVPFITLEPAETKAEHYFTEQDINQVLSYNQLDWKQIEQRAQRYPSVDALKNSEEFLKSYISQLPFYSHFTNAYSELVTKYVRLFTGKELPKHFSLYIYTVANSYAEKDGQLYLSMYFGFGYQQCYFDLAPGTGSGTDAESAIAACLESWILQHAPFLKQKLQEIIPNV